LFDVIVEKTGLVPVSKRRQNRDEPFKNEKGTSPFSTKYFYFIAGPALPRCPFITGFETSSEVRGYKDGSKDGKQIKAKSYVVLLIELRIANSY